MGKCLWLVGVMWGVLWASFTSADPFPPEWNSGAGASIHYAPVAWPSEPVIPIDCGTACGQWKPYTRFQQPMNDPRTRDPSNGGTSPQSYVNVTSSCSDKAKPSIYYYLHQGATASQDVLMFRWRVESAPHNYAVGPSAGSFGASNPWSSALWTVLFDVDGSGYRSLAAHLDGSSGSPAKPIDMLVGIWGNSPSHSLDYVGDPNVHLLGHNPTAFIGSTGKVLNFASSLTPTESWPNGAGETVWDYGNTRARLISTNSCTEYFIDYQIPIALLDASGISGPKITRSTPISMLFCTANSLNNPFQKDCSINRTWIADATKAAPFGDYLSFNQTEVYSQPIISKVEARAPTSCPGSYYLSATVQDTLALSGGVVIPSVQAVDFYYWFDADGDGTANDISSQWIKITPAASLVAGTFNKWTSSWNATGLLKGKYLVGAQALDDNTKLDDDMTATGINNRSFSYFPGDSSNKIYIAGAWMAGQAASFPSHSPSQSPSAGENWYGNPSVTGNQIALVGTAINACGIAPDIDLSVSSPNVVAGGSFDYTITLSNPVGNSSAVTISSVVHSLPTGFSYQNSTTIGTGGLDSSDPSISGQELTWSYGSPVSLAPGASASLAFSVTATSTSGNYNASTVSTTSFGDIQSEPAAIAVDAARLAFSIAPSAPSIAADGTTQLTFTLNYGNDSTVSVTNAAISASLVSGATYVSCSGGTACSNTSGNLSWSLGTLAAGATGSATLVMTIPNTWTTPSLTQAAMLGATSPDSNPVTKIASSSVAVTGYSFSLPAAFGLTKTVNATQIAPGGNVTYTISYSNYGGASASNVVITDTLPAGLTYASSTGGGVNASGTVTWTIGTVTAGASGSVTVTATAANPFTASNPASNVASINWTGGTPVASEASKVGITGQSCSTYYFLGTTGNVGFDGVERLASTSPIPVSGDTGAFVSVTAPVSGAAFLEALRFYQDPAASSDVPFDGNITTNIYIDRANGSGLNIRTTVYDYNSVTGAITQLAQNTQLFNGSTKGLLSFTVTPSGTLSKDHRLLWVYEVRANHASQTVDVQLQYAGTVTNAISGGTTFAGSNATYCITPPANLSTRVTVDDASIAAAATPILVYTINYSNIGSASATNTSLTNTLPVGFTGCEYSLNNSTWANCSTGSAHTFTLGTVTAGSSGTVYVRGAVPAGTTGGEIFTDTVALTSDQTSEVADTAITVVESGAVSVGASLAMALTSNITSAEPGESIIYTLKITNIGDTTATGVAVTNVLPVASYFTYNSCTGCNHAAGTLTWNTGTLAAGATQTYTYTMDVGSSGLSPGITVINDDASATGNAGLSASSNTHSIAINGNPELEGSIGATPNTGLEPEDTITYNLTLTNTGNAQASAVVIRNPIPANTLYTGNLISSVGTANFDAVNNQLVFNFGNLAASATVTASYTVGIASLNSGNTVITNSATATASNAAGDTFSINASASAAPELELTHQITGSSAYPSALVTANSSGTNLYVDKTSAFYLGQLVKIGATVARIISYGNKSLTLDAPVTVTTGMSVIGSIQLTLGYRNKGNANATSVSLDQIIPAGLTYYSADNSPTSQPSQGSSGTVTWSLGTLTPGASGSRAVIVFPSGIPGTYQVDGALSASNANQVDADVDVIIGGLTITKTTSNTIVAAGGQAQYQITLTNSLSSAITSVSVTDILPSGFSYQTGSALVGGASQEPVFEGADSLSQEPTWSGLTVPANSTLTINFTADVAADLGAATYQNQVSVTAGAGVGVQAFDAFATTAEDVTILAANAGVIKGYIFYRELGSGGFDANSDLPLAGVKLEIYQDGADCTDLYASTCAIVYTDNNGYYEKVVVAGNWRVKAISGTGDLNNSWTQNQGTNDVLVALVAQTSVDDDKGFTLATSSSSSIASSVAATSSAASSSAISSSASSASTSVASSSESFSSVNIINSSAASSLPISSSISSASASVASSNNSSSSTSVVNASAASSAEINSSISSERSSDAGSSVSSANTSISSSSSQASFTVTPQVTGNGRVTPSTPQSVVQGQTISFTLIPDENFELSSAISDCGGGLQGLVFTTAPIVANCSVQVKFASPLIAQDMQARLFTGATISRKGVQDFRVLGGVGNITMSASVMRAGNLTLMGSQSFNEFLTEESASLIDIGDSGFRFSATRAGTYFVRFEDEQGQVVILEFNVRPLVAFTSSYQPGTSGKALTVAVVLDEEPGMYPIRIAYQVVGNELATELQSQGELLFENSRQTQLVVTPNANTGEIRFSLVPSENQGADLGSLIQHRIELRNAADIPLTLRLSAQQNLLSGWVVQNSGGVVTLLANLPAGNYTYDWSGSTAALGITQSNVANPQVNPAALAGVYNVKVTATEVGSGRQITAEDKLRVVAQIPSGYLALASNTNSENYSSLPICIEGGMQRVGACRDQLEAVYLTSLPNFEIRLGNTSDQASWRDQEFATSMEPTDLRDANGIVLTNSVDLQYRHLGYRVDFEIHNLDFAGQSIPVVIPLKPEIAIPENAVWRKYTIEKGWHNFLENSENAIASATKDAQDNCPWPGDLIWRAGLNPGDNCVRLIIQDGGPNDEDGVEDAVVRDPSTLAVKPAPVKVTTVGQGSGGGGSLTIWWLLAFCALLGNFSRSSLRALVNKKR
ncbi:MAG: isopeptide-forming domain-containing fimbrial protein [Cellvibrio sp.]|uniref:beta strand repeat-containing protein n=1 Tax=Cellvibrio sp. TaxID=1965322 RepID=UPI00271CC4AA|nr:isopeptide-forming domain-containing fimbrial protein [Cellvibrio sp.]